MARGFLSLAPLVALASVTLGVAAVAHGADRRAPHPHLALREWLVRDTDDAVSLLPDASEAAGAAAIDPPPDAGGAPLLRLTNTFTLREPPAGAAGEPGSGLLDLRVRAATRVLSGTVTEDLELLGYGAPEAPDEASAGETPPWLFRLGVTGSWRWIESGIRLESVTPGLEKVTGPKVKPDQEGARIWLAARATGVRLKVLADAFQDNVTGDPRRPRTATAEAGVGLELTLPSGSLLGLEAARGRATLSPGRRDELSVRPAQRDVDSLAATLYHYGGPEWDVTLTSTSSVSAEDGEGTGTASVSHDLSGSYRPSSAVTVTPAVSVADSEPRGPGAGTRSVTGSLTLVLAPLVDAFDLSLYGGYSRTRTSDGTFDGRSLGGTATLTWHLRRAAPKSTLALEIGYHRYADAAAWAGRYEEAVALVVLKIVSF